MATTSHPKEEPNHPVSSSSSAAAHDDDANSAVVGWTSKIKDQFYKTKQNAEAYPYVWGSYIVVYGTLGLWLTYRWRKLRRTENNVRALHERLRKLVDEADKSGGGAEPPSSADHSKQ